MPVVQIISQRHKLLIPPIVPGLVASDQKDGDAPWVESVRHPSVRPHRRAQSRARPRARLGLYDDSDVLPERGEQPAQPLDREALEPPPVQVREIWLRDSEAASCRPLRQAPSLNQLLNRVR